ncbi:MAG: DUF948 domain-containing protein, partial [bacterium]
HYAPRTKRHAPPRVMKITYTVVAMDCRRLYNPSMSPLPYFFYIMMGVIAASFLFIAFTFLWIARSLAASSNSLKQMIEDADSRVKQNLEAINKSIQDANSITGRISGQMDRVDAIVKNIEHTTQDARSTVHLVESTVVPLFSNLYSIVTGVRRGIEVFRSPAPEPGAEGTPGAK